jgi:hypothetical protein
MAGYQSAFGNADAALRLISARSAFSPSPYRTVPYRTVPYRTVPYRTVPYRTVPVPLPLPCDLARSAHLSAQWHLVDTSTATDLQCIIVEDIQNWFLTGDTNESDTPDPIIQIGWFQVLKATYHNSGAQHKRFSSELKDFTQATIQANVDESAY